MSSSPFLAFLTAQKAGDLAVTGQLGVFGPTAVFAVLTAKPWLCELSVLVG
ncbi:hypothetical protein ABZS94_39075 [Streptomyces sp. NPDC005500]|uniref:hypothetical protein n=1 Tax=Streptomyces sp. NPDC005500 TaxID=3155007 RepID=UPI0033ADC4B0